MTLYIGNPIKNWENIVAVGSYPGWGQFGGLSFMYQACWMLSSTHKPGIEKREKEYNMALPKDFLREKIYRWGEGFPTTQERKLPEMDFWDEEEKN